MPVGHASPCSAAAMATSERRAVRPCRRRSRESPGWSRLASACVLLRRTGSCLRSPLRLKLCSLKRAYKREYVLFYSEVGRCGTALDHTLRRCDRSWTFVASVAPTGGMNRGREAGKATVLGECLCSAVRMEDGEEGAGWLRATPPAPPLVQESVSCCAAVRQPCSMQPGAGAPRRRQWAGEADAWRRYSQSFLRRIRSQR